MKSGRNANSAVVFIALNEATLTYHKYNSRRKKERVSAKNRLVRPPTSVYPQCDLKPSQRRCYHCNVYVRSDNIQLDLKSSTLVAQSFKQVSFSQRCLLPGISYSLSLLLVTSVRRLFPHLLIVSSHLCSCRPVACQSLIFFFSEFFISVMFFNAAKIYSCFCFTSFTSSFSFTISLNPVYLMCVFFALSTNTAHSSVYPQTWGFSSTF